LTGTPFPDTFAMPYVRRDAQGRIESLHRHPQPSATEFVEPGDPQLQALFGAQAEPETFEALDAAFVRVAEDLVELLLAKNLVTITDLPVEAQTKFLARRKLRDRLAGRAPQPFAASGFVDVIDDTAFGPL
jgi:hypothetical protein